ncbi:unnamed protein product [Caretta caretta]
MDSIAQVYLTELWDIHRFMSVNRLKYFFAVDTAYVTKKLALLLFPYAHQCGGHWLAVATNLCTEHGSSMQNPG